MLRKRADKLWPVQGLSSSLLVLNSPEHRAGTKVLFLTVTVVSFPSHQKKKPQSCRVIVTSLGNKTVIMNSLSFCVFFGGVGNSRKNSKWFASGNAMV